MKFTQIATDAFEKMQLNAGIILTEFTPSTPTVNKAKIFGATSGGVNFTATPEFLDFGEDIDNVPANTKEYKRIQSVTPVMSGTLKTMDTAVAKALIGAAEVDSSTGKITPHAMLVDDDFIDTLWWVGDYSDKNGDTNGGFVAIELLNALSTGGLQLQSNKDGKGDFAFEFTGHYSIDAIDEVPYNVYVKTGTAEPSQ
jgi:hypothetical protein